MAVLFVRQSGRGGVDRPDSAVNSVETCQNIQGETIEIIGMSHFKLEFTYICLSVISVGSEHLPRVRSQRRSNTPRIADVQMSPTCLDPALPNRLTDFDGRST